jgi:hypothetical protein
MDNDQVKDNYKKIMSAVNNASGPHFEIGQLRGEIWKLCCNLAQYEYQPPQDPDFSFWHTTVERAGTTYTLVLAHSDIEPPFLYEVQVNGSNIFDVLSDDVKDHFECIAYKEMMIGEEA